MQMNTFKILFLLLINTWSANLSLAQNTTIDSLLILVKTDKPDTSKAILLNNLCREYKNIGFYDTALYFGKSALQLAKQLNFQKGIADAYNRIGIIYDNQGIYDKALENYFVLLKIRKETGDKRSIADSYNNIGLTYYNLGNYEKALENYFTSLKIREEIRDEQGIADSYNNIAMVYNRQDNHNKALENFFASLKIREEIGDKQGIASSYINIGTVFCEKDNYDKALENYFTALKIQNETGEKQGIAASFNNIGRVYSCQGNYDKALENHYASLKIREEIGDKLGIATSFYNIGGVYADRLNYADAIIWLQKGLDLAKEIGAKDLVMVLYEELSDISKKMSDYKKAYQYHFLYSQIKDSIFNEKSNKQVAELQINYETEKKEIKIESQSHKLSEQELIISRSRLLIILITIGFLLLLILGWVTFSRYKIKKESKVKSEMLSHQEVLTKAIIETQEKERKRIAQDLHDGVGHKLTILKFNFEKIIEGVRSILPDQKIIFDQTEKILDETHKEVRTLSHSMMPKALQEMEFAGAVSDLAEQTLANSKLKYSLKNESSAGLPPTIQVCLYRILQELLNNILKHAQASEIAIQIFKNKNTILMMVEDNGTIRN